MDLKRESTHNSYWDDCRKYGKVEKPCDLYEDCKKILGIDINCVPESFDELWSYLKGWFEKQYISKHPECLVMGNSGSSANRGRFDKYLDNVMLYKNDVSENCMFNHELEDRETFEIDKNLGKPKALNGKFFNYESDFILPVEPLYDVIEHRMLNRYYPKFYYPKFCEFFYDCIFDSEEGLQIFKGSKDFHKDTTERNRYEEKEENRLWAKITSYDTIRNVFKCPYARVISLSDRWLMEKTVGFNMALKIYEPLRTQKLSKYLKDIIRIVTTCKPVHIRAEIAGDIFYYLDKKIGYEENKDFIKEIKTIIAEINERYQLLYWLVVDKLGVEKVCEALESNSWEEIEICEASKNEFDKLITKKNIDYVYDEVKYIQRPMGKDSAGSDYRAFAMIQREIIGQSYNYYSKQK